MLVKMFVIVVILIAMLECLEASNYTALLQHKKAQCLLEKLGIKYSVDKIDQGHRYHHLYCSLFSPIRHMDLDILEIGFGCGHGVHGRSALMWTNYFKNGHYYAIDYLPHSKDSISQSKRCLSDFKKDNPFADVKKIFFGDQGNTTFLQEVIKDYQENSETNFKTFDIIIDDGAHTYNEMTNSFIKLWPYISPGGLYVIEDLNHDQKFSSKVMNSWITLMSSARKERKNDDKQTLMENMPSKVVEMGCSYQICYFRKALHISDVSDSVVTMDKDVNITK